MPDFPLPGEPLDLLLGPDNDIVITDDLQFVYGVEGVMQECRIVLQLFAGEWFLNLDAGIPYWQQILGQKPQRAIAAAQIAFRRELEAVAGVGSVIKLNVSYQASRRLRVEFQVRTTTGETPADSIALRIGGGA